MISFVCCLFDGGADVPEWSRGVYDETWVEKLYRGLARNLGGVPFELICLVDRWRKFAEPVRQVILATTEPNWQALMEAFRPEFGIERGFLLGLDTVIVGNLAQITGYSGELAMLSDPYKEAQLCNGVMAWSRAGGLRVWREWEARTRTFDLGGYPSEMIFLRQMFPEADRLDRLYPGQCVSYKCHVRDAPNAAAVLAGARIVYMHGQPKPHQIADAFVKEHWR